MLSHESSSRSHGEQPPLTDFRIIPCQLKDKGDFLDRLTRQIIATRSSLSVIFYVTTPQGNLLDKKIITADDISLMQRSYPNPDDFVGTLHGLIEQAEEVTINPTNLEPRSSQAENELQYDSQDSLPDVFGFRGLKKSEKRPMAQIHDGHMRKMANSGIVFVTTGDGMDVSKIRWGERLDAFSYAIEPKHVGIRVMKEALKAFLEDSNAGQIELKKDVVWATGHPAASHEFKTKTNFEGWDSAEDPDKFLEEVAYSWIKYDLVTFKYWRSKSARKAAEERAKVPSSKK